jgi:nucleotide-binding universal stress UspA family protein
MQNVVVGTDGSDNASAALRWAVEEAALHNASLGAMLVWSLYDQHHPDRSDRFDPDYGDAAAEATLASWVAETLGAEAKVSLRTVRGEPVRALVEASDAADLLVLGARGKGGFEGLLLGSVSERVAQFANRPVAVVRTASPVRHGRVVTGIDGSARSLEALRWAAEEARARDADLEVVHAWRLPPMASPPVHAVLPDVSTLEENGRAVLDSALGDPALAGVKAHAHLTFAAPSRALLERAADATLLVVGTRGLGRVSGALIGSVSRQLLHHSPCPVVVI